MQELLEWVMEFEDKPVKPTLTNMKEKIWQLLPKERQQIEQAFDDGQTIENDIIFGKIENIDSKQYFNQTYQ